MSSANARLRTSSVMALPPYFTTTILPWYRFSHGSAAARTCGLDALGLGCRRLMSEYALFSWT